jgi:hypothetical protein
MAAHFFGAGGRLNSGMLAVDCQGPDSLSHDRSPASVPGWRDGNRVLLHSSRNFAESGFAGRPNRPRPRPAKKDCETAEGKVNHEKSLAQAVCTNPTRISNEDEHDKEPKRKGAEDCKDHHNGNCEN